MSIILATLNVLKEPYWRELKKQNIYFDEGMKKFIETRLLKIRRDEGIDKIVGTNSKT